MDLLSIIVYAFLLLLSIFSLICKWRIFTKCGRKGWEALIPIRQDYVYAKIAGKSVWFSGLILFPITMLYYILLTSVVDINKINSDQSLLLTWTILGFVFMIIQMILFGVNIVARVQVCLGLAERFGKSNGFGVGIFFLPIVFHGILAFENNKHQIKNDTSFESKESLISKKTIKVNSEKSKKRIAISSGCLFFYICVVLSPYVGIFGPSSEMVTEWKFQFAPTLYFLLFLIGGICYIIEILKNIGYVRNYRLYCYLLVYLMCFIYLHVGLLYFGPTILWLLMITIPVGVIGLIIVGIFAFIGDCYDRKKDKEIKS